MPLERLTAFGFALALLLLVAISALSWSSSRQQEETADWARHTQAVLARLESLLASVTDGETGVRGLLLADSEDYLEPYQAYLRQAPLDYQALRELIADNPDQQERLARLQPILEARDSEFRRLIGLQRGEGSDVATTALRQGNGKALHDQIRLAVNAMKAAELGLLSAREVDTRTAARRSRLFSAGGTLIAVVIVVVALFLIGREWKRRARTEGELLKINEALRLATARAEKADRVKSAFLASMSHELRTPLNSIIGFSGVLMMELAGPLNGEQKKQLGMLIGSSRHLLALINDILDISKIEADQLPLDLASFPLSTATDRVLALVAPLATAKGLAVRGDVVPDVGAVVADQRRIEQILINLLNNAIKFSERGEIRLSAERVDAVADDGTPRAMVRLRVSDHGIGMRPEDLPDLFQPFHQLRSGLDRSHEGTGLGLAICQRLVTRMGGRIEVASELGQGSVFTVVLPVNGAATQ